MWRSKKFIIIAVLAAVVMTGAIGGVALAQTGDEDNNPQSQRETLVAKICEIYQENTGVAIDQEALREAFNQARDEIRVEALENYLQRLVEEGKITQEEADQYKAWLEAKPDIDIPVASGLFGYGLHR